MPPRTASSIFQEKFEDGIAVFKVKDDGVGISAEKLKTLMNMEEEPGT